MDLYLNKLESPPTKDALCQVWLKLDSGSGEDENKKSLQTDGRMDGGTDRQTTGDQKSSVEFTAQMS